MLGTTIRERYKIIKYLGGSGLSETYLAEDIYLPNNCYYVIKQINCGCDSSFTTEAAKLRLKNQAKILYSLGRHDQIPKLLANFEENNKLYLVYEFIDGLQNRKYRFKTQISRHIKSIATVKIKRSPKREKNQHLLWEINNPKLEADQAVGKTINPQQVFLKNWSRSEIITLMALLITFIACMTSLARLPESINISGKNPSNVAVNQQSFRLTPKLVIYQDIQNGIKIKYPSNWERQDIHNPVTGEVAIFIPPEESDSTQSHTKIVIRIEDLSKQPMSLDEYTNSSILEIKKFLSNAKIVESQPTTIAELPAHILIYSGLNQPYSLPTNLEVWTLKNNKAYIITYTSTSTKYEQFLEIAKEMIKSLEIS
ncbi:MAG: PsbP-related protein [Crinalium sp.]